jgi:NTE family protein
MTRIGIALGAGGAKGIAHIPMLEALDEIGVVPTRIAGCSIGAVIGALYASGLPAVEIKHMIAGLAITRSDTVRGVFAERKLGRWIEMIDPDFRRSGLIKAESIMAQLCQERSCDSFSDLAIPLSVVATDFSKRQPVVLDSGLLKPAIQASMALPGLFSPVEVDGRVLIDGGTINPLFYDLLTDSCDIVVAIDINSGNEDTGGALGYFSTLFGSIRIMQQTIVEQQLRASPPDIYIRPDLGEIRTLQFHKADVIYRQAAPAKEQLKSKLARFLEGS